MSLGGLQSHHPQKHSRMRWRDLEDCQKFENFRAFRSQSTRIYDEFGIRRARPQCEREKKTNLVENVHRPTAGAMEPVDLYSECKKSTVVGP